MIRFLLRVQAELKETFAVQHVKPQCVQNYIDNKNHYQLGDQNSFQSQLLTVIKHP